MDPMTMRVKDRSHFANSIITGIDHRFQQLILINFNAIKSITVKTLRNAVMGNDEQGNP